MTKKEIKDFIKVVGLNQPVYVIWLDSMALTGMASAAWYNALDVDKWFKEEANIQTTGFLFRKRMDMICVVESIGISQVGAPIKIPTVAIKHIEKLSLKEMKAIKKKKATKKKKK